MEPRIPHARRNATSAGAGCIAAFLTALLLVISFTIWGCNSVEPPLLAATSPSVEALCRRVLDALAAYDTLTLYEVCLTRHEHDSILVPAMPIGQTSIAKDLEFAWYLLVKNREKGIRRALADYGGQRLELVGVQFTAPAEVYGPLRVYRKIEVRVRDTSGEEFPLGIFGAVIEHRGRFKLAAITD